MRRTSSDAEYLADGTLTVDADGIPVSLSGKADRTYVDDVMESKANKSDVGQALGDKADKSDLTGIATETYVDDAVSPKADKAYVDQVVPVRILTGQGFPEGKISAPVGSIYTDTAATNGAIKWIKTTGTGTTGWVVEYGNTGWRDITSTVSTSTLEVGNGGYVRIRRLERHVEYAFRNATVKTAGNISPTPSGFRVHTAQAANSYLEGYFQLSVYWIAFFGTSNTILAGDREFVIRVNAENSWPSTLPGLPT